MLWFAVVCCGHTLVLVACRYNVGFCPARHSQGITPLIIAATAQHADVVEALLQVGANVAHVADQGITALHMAAEHGSVDVIRKLLSTDAGKSAALMKDAHGLKPVEVRHKVSAPGCSVVGAVEGKRGCLTLVGACSARRWQ